MNSSSVLMTKPAGPLPNQVRAASCFTPHFLLADHGNVAGNPCRVSQDEMSGVCAPDCPFATPISANGRGSDARLLADDERELFSELARLRRQLTRMRVADIEAVPAVRLEAMRITCRACSIRRFLADRFFRLAVSVARKFATRYQDIDDLVGEACVTLMRALDRFDVERGYRFSTYATRSIRTELSRFVQRQRRQSDAIVDRVVLNRQHDSAPRRQVHPGRAAYCALEKLLDDLEPREIEIVRSRFGLRDEPGAETLQSVANRLDISRERVRQLEQAAIVKLRRLASESPWAELLDSVS